MPRNKWFVSVYPLDKEGATLFDDNNKQVVDLHKTYTKKKEAIQQAIDSVDKIWRDYPHHYITAFFPESEPYSCADGSVYIRNEKLFDTQNEVHTCLNRISDCIIEMSVWKHKDDDDDDTVYQCVIVFGKKE